MRNPYADVPRLSFSRTPQVVRVVGWTPDGDEAPRYIDVVNEDGQKRRMPAGRVLLQQLVRVVAEFDRDGPLGAVIKVVTTANRTVYEVGPDSSW